MSNGKIERLQRILKRCREAAKELRKVAKAERISELRAEWFFMAERLEDTVKRVESYIPPF